MQLDLFSHVVAAYQKNPDVELTNQQLYRAVCATAGIAPAELEVKVPIGASGQLHNLKRRQIRWAQQTLKRLRVVERVKGERGVWRLTETAKQDLHRAKSGVKLLAFSTDLGLAIWGPCQDVFKRLEIPITLSYCSPPYCLRKARSYGNPDQHEMADFICRALEPIVENLTEEASVVLNLSNDLFDEGMPSRSLYLERLTLALHDRLGLHLMDRLIWWNPSKPPGPVRWASMTRQQLNCAWEPVLWFAVNPLRCKSDNRRVLQPHSERHQRLQARGGEVREAVYGDGAYKLRPGSFGSITEGRIPRNVIERGHRCAATQEYRAAVNRLGLPAHGAGQPLSVPEFLIQFLTEPGDLVVDMFGGRCMTGLAAERNNRRWICTEIMLEYLRGGAELFRNFPGFSLNPALAQVGG
ncbi:TPA: DNA methyltransferase [Pseudomonas aeruginosa]